MPDPTLGGSHPENWRWQAQARSSVPSITVSDLSADARQDRAEKIRAGARVVPFGFARVIAPPAVERDPLLWEGED